MVKLLREEWVTCDDEEHEKSTIDDEIKQQDDVRRGQRWSTTHHGVMAMVLMEGRKERRSTRTMRQRMRLVPRLDLVAAQTSMNNFGIG